MESYNVYTTVLGGGDRSKILIRGVAGFSGITCIEEDPSAIARNSPFGRNLSESYENMW